jgi:MFS family permease
MSGVASIGGATAPAAAPSAQEPQDATHSAACAAISLLLGLTQGLGVNLVNANLSAIQGSLGATAVEASWLTIAYTATNLSAVLLLTKMRFQFGLRWFADVGIVAFLAVSVVHLFAEQLASAVLLRAMLGLAAAPLSSLALLYMMEAFPLRLRPFGLVLGFATLQVAAPLARVISSDLLQIGLWRGLLMVDVALSLLCVAALAVVRLKPVPTQKVFSPGDIVSFTLYAAALALLCVVLSEGRLLWWTDAPWLGTCLAAAAGCFGLYVVIELNRSQPLLDLRWLTSPFMLRFMLAILLFRVVLSEQTVGAVGLMTALGLMNDQMHKLFLWVAAGTVLGFALALPALAFKKLDWLGLTALLLIIGAAWHDAGVTAQTRPAQLIVSQTLLALATSMFLAAALAIGFLHLMASGMKYFISLIAVFTGGQPLAALAGSAWLGSFVTVRQKLHYAHLVEALTLADPQVASRIGQLSLPYGGTLGDAQLRAAQGVAGLGQQLMQQATVRAYNDLFELIAFIAALTLAWLAALKLWRLATGRALIPVPSVPTAGKA